MRGDRRAGIEHFCQGEPLQEKLPMMHGGGRRELKG